MKGILRTLILTIVATFVLTAPVETLTAQSQALNGQIEGTVRDRNNASVPDATVTSTNIETGATRTVTTDASGLYRMPLSPLGTYRITADARSFKRMIREGITLTTGRRHSLPD